MIQNIANLLEHNTVSSSILEELEGFKQIYQNHISKQEEQIHQMEYKIDTLENIRTSSFETFTYHQSLLQIQDAKIEELIREVTNLKKQEEESKLLNEVLPILEQLELINHRFDVLEAKANDNQTLINSLSMELKNSLSKPSSHFDIDRLNYKVVQIQDYLEKSVQIANEATSSKTNKKNKNVLTGQINLIDELLEDVPAKKTEQKPKKNFVVDYEAVKQKQERKGFSLFKSKAKNVVEEEETLPIVSQILLNHTQSVG